MGRMLAARSHSAGVFVFGRSGVAVFAGVAGGAWAKQMAFDTARVLAGGCPRSTRDFPAFHERKADELHFRRHAHADRSRLSTPLFHCPRLAAIAMGFGWTDSDW